MQPPAKDQYAKLASLYQKALSEADTSDDPETYRERARAAYDRAVAKVAQESTPQPAARQEPPAIAPVEEVTGSRMSPLRAAGTALATGLLPESLAGLGAQLRRPAGESAEAAYQRGMRQLGAQEEQAQEAIGGLGYGALQMAGGMKTAMQFPGVSARVAKDASGLAKTLAAGKRVAGSAGVAAAEASARQGMEENAPSPLQAGALGAGITAGLEVGFPVGGAMLGAARQLVSSVPGVGPALTTFVRRMAEPLGETAIEGRRAIADYLAPRFGQRGAQLAQMVEPTDITKVQRVVGQRLPTQGQTVEGLEQQATRLGQAVKTAEERVQESVQRTAARGEALEQRAKQQAETTLQQLDAEAEQLVGPLRSPQQRADALRQVTRNRQTTVGEMNYAALPAFTPGEVYPRGLYQRVESNQTLLSAFKQAVQGKRERILAGRLDAPDADVVTGVPGVRLPKYKTGRMVTDPTTGDVTEETKDVIDLEVINRMRQAVTDNMDARLSNSSTGITRSEGRKLLTQIDALEKDFFKTVPEAQRQALEKARTEYATEFANLRALQDGLNLFRFGVGGKAELLGAGKNDLRELLTDVSTMTPDARQHFRVGALDAIANMAAATPDDASKVIQNLVGTPEARLRLKTIFSKDDIRQLQQLLPEQAERTAQAFAGPTRRAAELLTQRAKAEGGLRTRTLKAQETAARSAADIAQMVAETSRQGVSALGDVTAGRGFTQTFPQTMTSAGRQDVAGVMAGVIQDQISGLRPAEAIRKLQELQSNPAARQMFGSSIDQALAQLQQQQSVFLPIRTAVAGQAAGRF